MIKSFDALLIGDITIDHNIVEKGTYNGPGGSLYYSGRTFINLGDRFTIVTPYGRDFPKHVFDESWWIPKNPAFSETLSFRNEYIGHGKRKQSVDHVNDTTSFFHTYVTDDIFSNKDVIFVAPLLADLDTRIFNRISSVTHGLKVFLPQGMFRHINPDNTISISDWENAVSVVTEFDIVVFSENDLQDWYSRAILWSLGKSIIIVTQAEYGCLVFEKGRCSHFGAYRVSEITDSTGSGDIFSAAFAHAYADSGNIVKSAQFANACAGSALRFRDNTLQYTLEEVYSFAKSQGEDVRI